jgi:hypothetical protein
MKNAAEACHMETPDANRHSRRNGGPSRLYQLEALSLFIEERQHTGLPSAASWLGNSSDGN